MTPQENKTPVLTGLLIGYMVIIGFLIVLAFILIIKASHNDAPASKHKQHDYFIIPG